MSVARYPVTCKCGTTLQVPGTDAGTTQLCRCGLAFEIPSLATLKRSVGVAAASADLQLQHLLQAKELPLETDCVVCNRNTDHQILCNVVCERPEEKGHVPFWQQLILFHISVWLYLLHMFGRRLEVHGRDVQFQLPIRVCEKCDSEVTSAVKVREALVVTPVYADLLRKYPHAAIARIRRR